MFETRVSGEVIEELKNGSCDIGFCSMIGKEPELEMVPVQRQKMVVIVPKGHRFWCRDQVPLEETLNEPQILFSPKSGLRKKMDRFFQQVGQIPEAVCEAEEHDVILELVSLGFGVAVMPELVTGREKDIRAIPISSPKWENVYYLARRKNDFRSRLEEEFFAFCREWAQE